MTDGSSRESGHEQIDHPADLGIRAWGSDLARAYEEAAWGLVEVLDLSTDRVDATLSIDVQGDDPATVLVDLLNELIFLADTRDEGVAAVRVLALSQGELQAEVDLGVRGRQSRGTAVKAATYHRLRVEEPSDGPAVVEVFLDV